MHTATAYFRWPQGQSERYTNKLPESKFGTIFSLLTRQTSETDTRLKTVTEDDRLSVKPVSVAFLPSLQRRVIDSLGRLTSLHNHCTKLISTQLHCTTLHYTALHCIGLQYSALQPITKFNTLHCTNSITLQCNPLHSTPFSLPA